MSSLLPTTTTYSSLVPQIKLFTHISSVEGLHSKIFTDVSTLLQICSIIDMWPFYPHPGGKNLHPPSLSIPMPQNYLRLTSYLRGTSLLCFSNVPSNHCLQSNLTLNSECVTPSCWKFFCGSHKWNQIQGINPPSSPCSLILHTSTILNHHQSSKWSLLSLCASVQFVSWFLCQYQLYSVSPWRLT